MTAPVACPHSSAVGIACAARSLRDPWARLLSRISGTCNGGMAQSEPLPIAADHKRAWLASALNFSTCAFARRTKVPLRMTDEPTASAHGDRSPGRPVAASWSNYAEPCLSEAEGYLCQEPCRARRLGLTRGVVMSVDHHELPTRTCPKFDGPGLGAMWWQAQPPGPATTDQGWHQAVWSRMRLTLRRSMPSSRAMARWLRPALCQARTVCSTLGASASAGGAPPSAIGKVWLTCTEDSRPALARGSVLIRVMRSSKEPASARAGQALTRAPMGPWPRPCARLAPMVAAMPAPRHQRAKCGTAGGGGLRRG